MNVTFTKQFSKQLDRANQKLIQKAGKIVNEIMLAKNIQDVSGLKKMKGDLFAYRIRLGNYRIGVFIEGDDVLFAVFAHRKDIYAQFP